MLGIRLSLFLLLPVVACGGSKAKSADDWAAPDVAEGKGVSFAPTDADPNATPGVTHYDDVGAGLHIEMPCSSGQKKTYEQTFHGAIKASLVRMSCTVNGTQYMLEYWRSADMIDQNKLRDAAESIAKVASDAEAGWELKGKTLLDDPIGWTNIEIRSMKGGKIRIDRTHVSLPRHVVLRSISSEADAPVAEKFHSSLAMREEGTPFGTKDTGYAMRSVALPPGKLSLDLPCVPKPSPVERETIGGSSITAQTTLWTCHHPSANIQYAGMFRRFDRPADGSPAEMKAINQPLAKQMGDELCSTAEFKASCKPGVPTPLPRGNGYELMVVVPHIHAKARVIADYPSLLFVMISAPRGAAELQSNDKIPERLRAAELARDAQSLADEKRTFASITVTAR